MSQQTPSLVSADDRLSSSPPPAGQADGAENIERLTDDLFQKTSDYVKAELEVTLDDYKLLEQMNRATAAKYSELRGQSEEVKKSLADLDANYARMIPFLEKMDGLEKKVVRLEELAYAVDGYSKRLEGRFKSLEKR